MNDFKLTIKKTLYDNKIPMYELIYKDISLLFLTLKDIAEFLTKNNKEEDIIELCKAL